MPPISNLQTAAPLSDLPEFGVDRADAFAEICAGLTQKQAVVSPKYLYDPLGSKLFEAITQLSEYYPTRTERGIFERHATEFARCTGTGTTLIDLGAGNCAKASGLFPALRPAHYVAVDVSAAFLHNALHELRHQYPKIEMQALGLDFSAEFTLPPTVPAGRRLFFYPGSSIGNFSPDHAREFLGNLRHQCGEGGGLLIGVDLVKPAALLEPAYDDALGVTAAFNLNLLNHLNSLIGTDFQIADWKHVAFFNAALARIEMHLEARRTLTISWAGGTRRFAAGERIHTECSYKYELLQFQAMLVRSGFRNISTWTDERNWFAVCHASV